MASPEYKKNYYLFCENIACNIPKTIKNNSTTEMPMTWDAMSIKGEK